jgi:hypothetical protein
VTPAPAPAKTILLTRGLLAQVDADDYERVSQFKWYAKAGKQGKWYAASDRPGKAHEQKLHRFILNAPPDIQVDHRDGDGLNCQRANLRLCTNAENQWNSGKKGDNRSGYKGVSFESGTTCKRKWRACIKVNSRNISIGRFETAIEAAHAYDAKARELHGEFGFLNFPGDK